MTFERIGRQLSKLNIGLRSPRRIAELFRESLQQEFEMRTGASALPEIALSDLVITRPSLKLVSLSLRNGNVSLAEIVAIGAIAAEARPQTIVEIGTFDGNTSLQLAANVPEEATVYTLDLPMEFSKTAKRVETADQQFIENDARVKRRYLNSEYEKKIVQLEGDSATFNFEHGLLGRRPELAFIDGSHSYEYIKSDTEAILKIMAPGGRILWHDYTPAWPGVIQYLGELGQRLPVVRILDTTLVFLRLPSN